MSETERPEGYRDYRWECPRCESYSTAFIGETELNTVPLYWWACTECGVVWSQTDAYEFKQRLNDYYKFKAEGGKCK